ncbi:MAG TPA: TraB family protein [Polyangiaceae bacterium]
MSVRDESEPEPAPGATAVAGTAAVPSESITRLEYEGREIFLLGTAHVSKKSVEEVEHLIDELRPDVVCVELDRARYETLLDESRWRRLDVRAVLREDRAGLMLASLLFSGFQKRLGDRLGVRPGSEMLAAARAAERVGAKIVLADRDVQATLRRCYGALGALDRAKIFVALGFLPFAAADIEEADVERLKGKEAIGDAMGVFAQQMPALKVPLIDERDQYLVASTRAAPGRRIVSVVGAAHVAGMVRYLSSPVDRAALSEAPGQPLGESLREWSLTAVLALLLGFALGRGGSAEYVTGLLCRVLLAGAAGSFFAVLAVGGSILTALAALSAAPLTLAFPVVPLGTIAGEVQARVRFPSPEDAAAVRADMLTPSRLRQNRFIVVLLVTVAAQLGRTIGALLGLLWALIHLRH